MTSGVDQMVALHTSSQDDVLLCLQGGALSPNQDRVGELVGTLVDHFTRSVTPPRQAPRSRPWHQHQACEEQTSTLEVWVGGVNGAFVSARLTVARLQTGSVKAAPEVQGATLSLARRGHPFTVHVGGA